MPSEEPVKIPEQVAPKIATTTTSLDEQLRALIGDMDNPLLSQAA